MSSTPRHSDLSRREFVAVAATAAAALSGLALGHQTAAASGVTTGEGFISEVAFNNARRRAAALVAKMTLAEKAVQCGSNNPPIKRIGLPAYNYWNEGLHGVCVGGPVTSFPLPLAMGCSWNPQLVQRMYDAESDEARAYNNRYGRCLTYFSPATVNMGLRDPRWGRIEENFSEDTMLVATFGVAATRGMQGDNPKYLKTVSCAKHYICNDTDSDRDYVSAEPDWRSLWEYYSRGFEALVTKGRVFSVMAAYNSLWGIPCPANHMLLTDILRTRWGFKGYVVSDCDAVGDIYRTHHYVKTGAEAAALAIRAGCDLNCGSTMPQNLAKSVELKLVRESEIDEALTRVLTGRFLLGEFDPPEQVPFTKIKFDIVASPKHQQLAMEAARSSIVLLKNENHFLPLDKAKLKTVAVIGPTAGTCHLGQYSGSPFLRISPYEGIADKLGVAVIHTPGKVWPDQMEHTSPGVQTQGSSEGGMNFGWIGNGSWIEYRPQDFTGKKRIAIRVSSPGSGAVAHVHVDSLTGPRIATLKVPHTNGWQNWKTVEAPIRHVSGKHKVFVRFIGKGAAICNMEWLELQPIAAAKAPPLNPDAPVVVFKPGCGIEGNKDQKMFDEAVEAARQADVAILVCGVNSSVDGEGHDRKDIKLTGAQHELIRACHAVNPKTVLVVSSNAPVAINWEQANLPAIVSAIFAGQAQGTAIADVLFGNFNPGGKTNCTWFKSLAQLPPMYDYDVKKGRTYLYFEGEPLYPFGYGLSYTQFKFSDLKISGGTLSEKGSITASARITNTGGRDGSEVAQFYISAPKSPVKRPIKQLVGFQRVELKAGQSKTVTFTLPYTEQALWYWHEKEQKFVLQPGTLKLMIGSSSADIHLRGHVSLAAS